MLGQILSEHSRLKGDIPASQIIVCRRDVLVIRSLPPGVNPPKNSKASSGKKRQVITQYSNSSRLRLTHFTNNCDCDFHSMLTLTYPSSFSTDGRTVKKHLNQFLSKHLDRKFPGQWVWFLEFQKRGAPHYHILSTVNLGPCVEKHYYSHKRGGFVSVWINEEKQTSMQKSWFDIVASNDQKHLRAGLTWERIEQSEGALRYAAKHAAKNSQKEVPKDYQNVGRFWGHSQSLKVKHYSSQKATTEQIFEACGNDALSRSGKLRKYLWGYGLEGTKNNDQ